MWNHYKKGKGYTFDEIVEWTSRFQSGASSDISSEEVQNAIYQLHWDIYQESERQSSDGNQPDLRWV